MSAGSSDKNQRRLARVGKIEIGGGRPLALIAGPCVIESRAATLELAARIRDIAFARNMPLIFKASYDKANRSSARSYRGPGLDEGLDILAEVKRRLNLPVISDVHETTEVTPAARILDALQIPAFLCRQTDLIVAAAKTGRPINVKKGQFMAPWDMKNVLEKVRAAGNDQALLTERGVSFGYNNLVVDMRAIPAMQALGAPVVFDATHSTQLPGGLGAATGGQREMAHPLALAAVAAGCDAIFLETHPEPAKGMSDAATMLPLAELPGLLDRALRVRAAVSD